MNRNTTFSRLIRSFTVSALLIALLQLCALAQGTTATLTGTIFDPRGAAVAGAIVSVSSKSLGISRQTTTDGEGNYISSQLPPGAYNIKVEASGFAITELTNLILQIGQQASQNISLTIKGGTETVTIEGGGQVLVNTQNGELGEVIENKRIIELPLNGRQFTQLIALTPGIGQPAGGTSRQDLTGGFDNANFTVHGARETDNFFKVDGVAVFDRLFNTITVLPSVDAIQEFRVKSSTYGAEEGAQGGGQVTVALKSGTNSIRGSLYEYFRNEALDARNPFNNTRDSSNNLLRKAANRQNQYGGTLGFPIYKDKLFGFGSYEGYRLRRGDSQLITVPLAGVRQGNLLPYLDSNRDGQLTGAEVPTYPAGLPALTAAELAAFQTQGILPARVFNASSAAILNQLPLPNLPGLTNNLAAAPSRRLDQDQFSVRGDWRPDAVNSLFVRYLHADVTGYNPFGAGALTAPSGRSIPGYGSLLGNDSRNIAIGYTTVFNANLVGTLLFGYNHLTGGQTHENQGTANAAVGSQFSGITQDPQYLGVPNIRIDGAAVIDQFGDVQNQLFRDNEDYQYGYDISWTKGAHTLKGGVLWTHLLFRPTLNNAGRGGYRFNGVSATLGGVRVATGSGLANYLLGVPEESFAGGLVDQRFTGNEYGFYAQDDWKIGRRLTVNLGVRYELVGELREEKLRMAVLDYKVNPAQFPVGRLVIASRGNGVAPSNLFVGGNTTGYTYLPLFGAAPVTFPVVSAKDAGFPDGLFFLDKNNWAPRLGFAWDIFGTAKTVLRGGAGVFYSRPTYNTRLLVGAAPPFYSIVDAYNSAANVSWNNSLTRPIAPFTGGVIPFSQNVDPYAQLGQTNQISLSLQQALTSDLVVEGEYVGKRGHSLQEELYFNSRLPAATVPNLSATASRAQRDLIRPFPRLGGFSFQSDTGDSWYHAGILKLTKRFSAGTTFFTSYTWAKSLDTGSFGAAPTSASTSTQAPLDRRADMKGRSDFDIRHRFVFSGSLELPFGKGRKYLNQGGVADAVLGGWALAPIVTLQSNAPLTAYISNISIDTVKGSGLRPNLAGDPNTGARTPAQWFNLAAFRAQNPDLDPGPGFNLSQLTYGSLGRNVLEGPSYKSVDFSLLKNFRLTERFRMQFRAEFFNALNFVNYNLPFSTIDGRDSQLLSDRSPNPALTRFGTINSARPAREIQFALRLDF